MPVRTNALRSTVELAGGIVLYLSRKKLDGEQFRGGIEGTWSAQEYLAGSY